AETSKEIEVWVEDPATHKLVPKLDERTRQPMPRISQSLEKVGIHAQEDPLGFLGRILPERYATALRSPTSWFSILGVLALFIAFGHSVLAMSGEETLAQVYREVESPKLKNFKKAAFIVFIYSLFFTATISFLAVAIIPNDVRMKFYSENFIGGLARYVVGTFSLKWFLGLFVVGVGFFFFCGAVITDIL